MGLDPLKVATHVGTVKNDQRLLDCIAAAERWVEKRRSNTKPDVLWADDDVQMGGTLYAGLIYTARAQPQGYPGMNDLGTYSEDTGQAMVQVYRLVGADPVIA